MREAAQDAAVAALASLEQAVTATCVPGESATPVLHREAGDGEQVAVCYRQAGDKYLLVEYGPLVLDLKLRFRVHALMTWLIEREVPGIVDLTPGIRSLQLHYDSRECRSGRTARIAA